MVGNETQIITYDDLITPKLPSRRDFLRLSAAAGLFVVGGPLLIACGSPSPEQQKLEQLKQALIKQAKEQWQMNFKESFRLSSGIKVSIFTDGPNLTVNQQAFDKAFHVGFDYLAVLSSQHDNPYWQALLKAKQFMPAGKYKDREYFCFVSANPQACLVFKYNEKREVEDINIGQTTQQVDRCTNNATTLSVLTIDRSQLGTAIPVPEAKLAFSLLTASTTNGQAIFKPADGRFVLNTDQALSSDLTHEALHAFLRMDAVAQGGKEEEYFIQSLEREVLAFYQTHPEQRPVPFTLG